MIFAAGPLLLVMIGLAVSLVRALRSEEPALLIQPQIVSGRLGREEALTPTSGR